MWAADVVTDKLRPAERWCRVCHRLEREVPMYRGRQGAICRACFLANNALQKYWRTQREKLRMAPA